MTYKWNNRDSDGRRIQTTATNKQGMINKPRCCAGWSPNQEKSKVYDAVPVKYCNSSSSYYFALWNPKPQLKSRIVLSVFWEDRVRWSNCLVHWPILDESDYSLHQWPFYIFHWPAIGWGVCICTCDICCAVSIHMYGVLVCINHWWLWRRQWCWSTISVTRRAWIRWWGRRGRRHGGLISVLIWRCNVGLVRCMKSGGR